MAKLSQSEILRRLGIPTTPTMMNRINGNGRLQQNINQQATLHGLPEPFSPSTAQAIIQDLLPIGGIAAGAGLPEAGAGAAAAGGGAASSAANAAGNAATAAKYGAFGLSFGALTDFLGYIGWLFHPLNWLRLVEFITGMALIGWGIYMLTQRRGTTGNITGTARRIISMTPAGREIRMAQGRRMGRHEGQREAARMEARQAETLGARQRSARERVQINRNAREQ
jgi:hypothetical protein